MLRSDIKLANTSRKLFRRYLSKNATDDIHKQYIERSIISTMHFQKSLPRLPVPKLETTCQRYLAALQPILDNSDYEVTKKLVHNFQGGPGKKLQEHLVELDKTNKHTSYITGAWFEKYLKDRTPLPINSNPVLVFQNDQRKDYCDQAIRATNLLYSSLRFYKSLLDNILEPEVFHLNPKKSDTNIFRQLCSKTPNAISWYTAYLFNAYPLDMSQYHNLFNTTRIPLISKDKISKEIARHILIQHKGHFYTFNVLDEDNNIIEPELILSAIQKILNSNVEPAKYPIGIFTTCERNKWAKIRQHLVDTGNESSLKLIDSALFNICLDSESVDDDKYKIVRTFLHGTGENRWFDKSISLQLSKDGYAAINFEHSWGDGVAVLRFFQDIFKDSTKNSVVHPTSSRSKNIIVAKLEFQLDDSIKASCEVAIKDYQNVCNSMDVNFVESNILGKKACKKYKISPDSAMQLCFQSAFYKQYGNFVGTYESCSTAAFKHGRTETIRPCTMATKNYCLAVHGSSKVAASDAQKLIKECSTVHSQLTKEAAMGQGFDRHLFALKMYEDNVDLSGANIYEDLAYKKINHNILSTSTLSSPAVMAGGFGPVVGDGFGVGYVIRDDAMGTLVTSYPTMNGKELINNLNKSMEEVVYFMEKEN